MCRVSFRLSVLVVACFAACSTRWAEAQLVVDYEAERHARYYQPESENDPPKDFVGEHLDFSGVAVSFNPVSGLHERAITMISDTYFVTAGHFTPKVGWEVSFYPGNDQSVEPWVGVVKKANIVRVGYTPIATGLPDLSIGQLTEAPPTWVKRYPLIKRAEKTNYVSFVDPAVWIYTQHALARAVFQPNSLHLTLEYNDHDASLQRFGGDALFRLGGSGYPTFVELASGRLAIAGIHSTATFEGPGGADASASAVIELVADAVETDSNGDESIQIATDALGDLNGDFETNSLDVSILIGNFGHGPNATYNEGDLNGDGFVDAFDVSYFSSGFGSTALPPADFDKDGDVDRDDMKLIGANWLQAVDAPGVGADANKDGVVNQLDIDILNSNWDYNRVSSLSQPHPELPPQPGDADGDGSVGSADISIVVAYIDQSVDPFTNGDLDGDGVVSPGDLDIVDENFGRAIFDANEDGQVDNTDLSLVIVNWMQATSEGRAAGDMNADGFVDHTDFDILAHYWNWQVRSAADHPPLATGE